MFGDTVEALTYPMVFDRGRLVPDYTATPAAAPMVGVDAQPGVSTELIAQRTSATEVRWTVIVPASVMVAPPLTENSIVRLRGEVFQVEGKPLAWLDDRTLGHYVLSLTVWEPQ